MRIRKLLYYTLLLFLVIFLIYSYYQWWIDTPWRNKWRELMKNLENFVSKEIELKGEVVNPYTIVGTNISVYTLEFENFKCDVISVTGIPEEGGIIIVKGKLKKDYKVESFFGGRKIVKSFSWVILEEGRREEE